MKLKGLLLALALLLTACEIESPEDSEALACSPSDRNGTYLIQYTLLDGNCGEMSDELVRFPAPASEVEAWPCMVTSEEWSENDCRYDVTVRCEDGSTLTGYSIQEDEEADEMTGMVSLGGGPQFCRGTYDLQYTRQ